MERILRAPSKREVHLLSEVRGCVSELLLELRAHQPEDLEQRLVRDEVNHVGPSRRRSGRSIATDLPR